MIAFVVALVFGGTQAFFNDEETSSGNLFTAGALDLLVDSQSHYAGLECIDGLWVVEDQDAGTTRPDLEDTPCDGTWEMTDLGPEHTFFNFSDLKPGDEGENTISLHVEDNDAYACVIIDNMQDDDNELTEPEEEAGDSTGGAGEGELSQELRFFAWSDMSNADEVGNNIWEAGEPILFSNVEGPASDVIDGVVYPLFTPDLNGGAVLPGAETQYIGLYWCYGDITVDQDNNTLSCDGAGGTNLTQTDSLSADFTFYVEQARNNGEFSCPVLDTPVARTPVGAALAAYQAPTCDATVSGTESIQAALDVAPADSTVCVADDYDATGDDVAIRMETTGVTLAAVTRGTAVDVPVVLSADGVTVTGLTGAIGQAESPSEVAAFYFDGDATNATLSYSTVVGLGVGAAVLTESGADNSGSVIANNSLSGAVQGIYLNPHTGIITIENNDIDDNVAGIGNLNGALVQYNEFEHTLAAQEAIGAGNDGFGDYDGSTIQFNNFLDDTRINAYTSSSILVDAPNNFFGPNGAATQAPTDVDFTPEEVSAFPHN